METQDTPFMSAAEVAALFNVTPRTVHNWADEGLLPVVKLGKTVRYHRDDVQAIVDSRLAAARRHPRNFDGGAA